MFQIVGRPARAMLLSLALAACRSESPFAPEPEQGVLEVEVVTSGVELASGYSLLLEGGLWESVGAQALHRRAMEPGTYRLELGEVPDNCAVAGENPRTLAVARGDTARTVFAVACSPTGSVRVLVTAAGEDRTPYEYDVTVSGHPGVVETGSSAVIDRVPGGPRLVTLSGLPHQCAVDGEHPRSVTAVPGDTVPVELAVTCGPAAADRFLFAYVRQTALPVTREMVYVSGIEGLGRLRLTGAGVNDRMPVWSPDGSRLAFVRQDGEFLSVVVRSDGSDERVIATLANEMGRPPVWSPDGERVAFAGFRDLYVARADGGGVTNLTNDGRSYSRPAWSPDGTALAFASVYPGNSDIYSVAVDGGPVVRLTSHSLNEVDPIWSPDGTRIGFTRLSPEPCPNVPCPPEALHDYVLITAEGVPVATFPTALGIWSPDLTRFAQLEGGWVRVIDLEGTTLARNPVLLDSDLPPYGGLRLSWSPSGTWLLAASVERFAVIRADGAGSRVLPGLIPLFNGFLLEFDFSPAWNPYP